MSLLSTGEPTVVIEEAERRITYRWEVRRVEDRRDSGLLVVRLRVHHFGSSKQYSAALRNATETDSGFTVESFGLRDPVWNRSEKAARYSRRRLREFAEETLVALRDADTTGEELHVDLVEAAAADIGASTGDARA